jgi:N-acetylmuramoyl-L-alanine amidase
MPWSSGRSRQSFGLTVSISTLLLVSVFLLRGAPNETRITIYSTAANYSLPIAEHGGQDYVGLFETLEPLGKVSAKSDGSKWKLRYNNVDAEFVNGKKKGKINGHDMELPGNFVLESGRGLVPLSSLSTLLPLFLGGPVSFHESSRRLFVGEVAVHFTAQIDKTALVMNFTSAVNPSISTEPGRLKMTFTHEPLVPPGSQTLTFDSKTIPTAMYSENNGAAEIEVSGSVPLFASFSNDGKTITVSPAGGQAIGQTAAAPGAAVPPPSGTAPTAPPAPQGPRRYFAVVDASHGGDERGAALNDQIAEKDVTLAFARRLRSELESRGLTTLLVRDGDFSLTLDQRANLTNSTHPAIYICLHATSQGSGVHLYTAMVPSVGQGRGPFLDWDTAQSAFLGSSQAVEANLWAEFGRRQVSVRALAAPLRPLNNVIVPAVAVEVAPSPDGVPSLLQPGYQQLIASSIATGVAATRDKLEAGR